MVSSFCSCLFTYTLANFLKLKNHCCFVVGSYFNLLFQVQPYRSTKFAKKFGKVPKREIRKIFRNGPSAKLNPCESVKISRMD